MSHASRLRITEIFYSLQGEALTVGCPTVFVRLTGCPLRCRYCDSAYAFHGGQWRDVDGIVSEVKGFGAEYVTVTGGEPLAQKGSLILLSKLCDAGLNASLETSGALSIEGVDSRVSRVIDIKVPGSGEVERNCWDNLALLTSHDQVKFVLCNEEDYCWAKAILVERKFPRGCEILFSACAGELEPSMLADWIVRDRLKVRFQMQMHKLLWGDEPGR